MPSVTFIYYWAKEVVLNKGHYHAIRLILIRVAYGYGYRYEKESAKIYNFKTKTMAS